MKTKILALALAGTAATLSGCVTDEYGYGGGYAVGYGSPYAYDGWYDGYYDDIYDGYWGRDNYFYYRGGPNDHRFRRADRNHFMRQAPPGQHSYRQMQGEFRPQQGMQMPRFQGGQPGGPRGPRPGGHHR